MPPEAATSPNAAPETAPAPIKNLKEEDDSQAGSMTLLLPQQVLLTHPHPATTGKQTDQRLPMPSLQRPRKRLVVRTSPTASASHCTTWVLALLTAAAVMAALASAAMAMAARAEISRLRAEVDNVRTRLMYHETLQNIHKMMESAMEPAQEDEEDGFYEAEEATDTLSPAYPDLNEFEFAADVKGSSASSRHNRRHIPTVSASYESSENGWRPEKPEKRLKLYETLASGTSPPQAAEPPRKLPDDAYRRPAPAVPYHHRSSGGRLVAAMTAQRAPPMPAVPLSSTTDKVVVARRQEPSDS